MIVAYILSRLVRARLRPLAEGSRSRTPRRGTRTPARTRSPFGRGFARWEADDRPGIRMRTSACSTAPCGTAVDGRRRPSLLLVAVVVGLGPSCAANSSPKSMPAPSRCPSAPPRGTRIEVTEKRIVEGRGGPPQDDRRRSGAGHQRDRRRRPTGRPPTRPTPGRWTPSSRSSSRRERSDRPRSTSHACREAFTKDPQFADLEFAFDAGGMIRSA